MKYMIEIREDKVEKLSEHIEKGLHHLGRAMGCVEQMLGQEYGDRGGMNYREHESEHDGYGRYGHPHEGGMGERYPYMYRGSSMGYRDDEDMMERRRRDSRGRYM
jgi:hypothetical protein